MDSKLGDNNDKKYFYDEINNDLYPYLDKIPRMRTAMEVIKSLDEWNDPEPVECESGTVDPPYFIIPNNIALQGIYNLLYAKFIDLIHYMLWRMKQIATNRIEEFYTPALLDDMVKFIVRLEMMNIDDYIGVIDITSRYNDEYIRDHQNIIQLFKDKTTEMRNPVIQEHISKEKIERDIETATLKKKVEAEIRRISKTNANDFSRMIHHMDCCHNKEYNLLIDGEPTLPYRAGDGFTMVNFDFWDINKKSNTTKTD